MIDKYIGAIGKLEQDYLRRIVLREHDASASTGIAPEFITNAAAFALGSGYHVILEGILHNGRYARALRTLITEHAGPSFVYYLDVFFEETVRRHANRPQAADFDPDQMREWLIDRDLLGTPAEHVIPESSTFVRTVDHILMSSQLTATPPTSYCPTACPRCVEETMAAASA